MEIPEFYCLEIYGFSLAEENRRLLIDIAVDMMTKGRKLVSINNSDDTILCLVKKVETDVRHLGMSGSIFQVVFEESRGWRLKFFVRNTNNRVEFRPAVDRREADRWFVGPDRRETTNPTTLH
jgi:hypothetical protein